MTRRIEDTSEALAELLSAHQDIKTDFEERMTDPKVRRSTEDYIRGAASPEIEAGRTKAVAYERLDPIRAPALLRNVKERPTELATYLKCSSPWRTDEPALLSAMELLAYQDAVSLVQPFDARNLKSSSYEVHAAGRVIYWDTPEKGESRYDGKRSYELRRGERLRLPANSIVYVQTEVEFSLPLYMAVRFNLRITHVHRGLLLGTGPLVDPGFRGQIFIPLHNLTDSDYWIDTAEPLIAVEFTRTSYDRNRDRDLRTALEEDGITTGKEATAFDERKRMVEPEQYLRKANGQEPIRSSIGPGIEGARRAAQTAQNQVRTLTIAGVIAFAVAFATFLATVFAAIQAVDGAGEVQGLEDRIRSLETRIEIPSGSGE